MLKSRRPIAIHLPLPMFGSFSNTVGRPSGSSRVTISPAGLWYMRMRARGSAKRTFTSSPLMRTSSPGPDLLADVGRLAVHGDAAGEDHLLHRAARAEAARRQHLVQALRLGEDVVSGGAVARRRQALRDLLQRQARLLHRARRRTVPGSGSRARVALRRLWWVHRASPAGGKRRARPAEAAPTASARPRSSRKVLVVA